MGDLQSMFQCEEIQSVLNAPKSTTTSRRSTKKNPLTNIRAMLKLNPNVAGEKRTAWRAEKVVCKKAKTEEVTCNKAKVEEQVSKPAGPYSELYKCTNDDGPLETKKVATGPNIDKNILESDDCYILVTNDNLFVWKGPSAEPVEESEAIQSAIKFLMAQGKVLNLQVFPEGEESAAFKANFKNWA